MKTKKIIGKGNLPPQRRQKGVIAVIVAIGIAALVGVVGLALDSGHLLLNKTRLQNAVDAAALSGGRVLLTSTSGTPMVDARSAAEATFTANLSSELNGAAPVPTVTFSEDLTPGSFTATVGDPKFIKVSSPVISLTSFLIKAVGFDDKEVAAVAVAGFGSGAGVCDMIPIMVCGDATDTNHTDGTFFGYDKFDYDNPDDFNEINLKLGTAEGWDPNVGSGNYHLLNVGGTGGDVIREGLAGSANCGIQDDNNILDTAPGEKVGPVVSGINTRFGIYKQGLKPSDYPADYANQDSFSECVGAGYNNDNDYDTGTGSNACLDPGNYFEAYSQHSISWPQNIGPAPSPYLRRKVTMPIANCGIDGDANGRSQLPTLGFGCFLLTRPAEQGGSGSDSGSIWGVFLEECNPPTEGITEDNGTTTIVLFKNPDGADS